MAYDFQSGFSGAGTGAIYGAQLGGGPGAVAGGIIGGLSGFFGKDKNKKKPEQISTFDPYQKQLFEQKTQALQGNGGPLADVYGPFNSQLMRDYYEKSFAQPAYQEFQENVVPTITGAFRGKNLQNSSYLGGALANAGSKVQNNLNGQLAELLYKGEQSSLDRRSSALDRILNLQTHVDQRQQPSIFDSLLSSLSNGAGDLLADYLKSRNKKTPNPVEETPKVAPVATSNGG